jgi:hypothetical protein
MTNAEYLEHHKIPPGAGRRCFGKVKFDEASAMAIFNRYIPYKKPDRRSMYICECGWIHIGRTPTIRP